MCAHIYTNSIIAEENIFLKYVPTVFKNECFWLIDLLYSKDFIKKKTGLRIIGSLLSLAIESISYNEKTI